jgi:hypothetical protein
MSERTITPKFLAQEFDMLREHMLDMKRACFDHYGQTAEGYRAHVICSNIEPMLAEAAALIAKARAS